MRFNFRYGVAIGILAAAFGMLGPMADRAPGTSVPTGAGAVSLQAPPTHLSGIAGRPIVLTSMIERSARQHDIGIAQRADKGLANGREQLGLPGLANRTLLPSHGCGWGHCGYGYGGGCGWDRCGYYGGGCGWGHCGYGYGGGCGWDRCGYYGGGCGWGHCGYGYGGGCGWGHCGYR